MKASDGMWDVINVETVRRLVMKFESPEEVAIALAQSASNLRAAHNVRRDDPHVYYDHYTSSKCVIV
jgi:serine/threonine protein phosphatase PrpC